MFVPTLVPIQPCSGALLAHQPKFIVDEITMSLTSLLFGRRLANREVEGRKIGAFEGVPAMGFDGLGSASYGPEAMLTVLAVAGTAGLGAVQPITWAILALLLILFFPIGRPLPPIPATAAATPWRMKTWAKMPASSQRRHSWWITY